jgi:hypothetical protein
MDIEKPRRGHAPGLYCEGFWVEGTNLNRETLLHPHPRHCGTAATRQHERRAPDEADGSQEHPIQSGVHKFREFREK